MIAKLAWMLNNLMARVTTIEVHWLDMIIRSSDEKMTRHSIVVNGWVHSLSKTFISTGVCTTVGNKHEVRLADGKAADQHHAIRFAKSCHVVFTELLNEEGVRTVVSKEQGIGLLHILTIELASKVTNDIRGCGVTSTGMVNVYEHSRAMHVVFGQHLL